MTKINPLQPVSTQNRPVVLAILDGVGWGPPTPSNAVTLANTPTLDAMFQGPQFCQLNAHGRYVGMPSHEDMGNSEVGHNALGAGRVVDQGALLVDRAIQSKALFRTQTWQNVVRCGGEHKGTVHLIGLLSDGNVHANMRHLHALLTGLTDAAVNRVRVHILLDGRDVPARSALTYIDQLETWLAQINQSPDRDYAIASGGGRMVITMDRYGADWPMVARGWQTHVHGQGPRFPSARAAVMDAYDSDPNQIDQYIPPFVIDDNGAPMGKILDGDSVVLFNFRGDRAIQLSQAFEMDEWPHFDRLTRPSVVFAGMMQYDADTATPSQYLVSSPVIDATVSHYLCATGVRSLAISETQKFGHVTFFWNGNQSGYIDDSLEHYVDIRSDSTTPFHRQPTMKAPEITEYVCRHITNYDFIRVNYPNGDMVGHTGDLDATIQAMQAVDRSMERLWQAVRNANGILMVVSDHGNADDMSHTAHTLNPVPCVILDDHADYRLLDTDNAGITRVAATLCQLLGYQAPDHFDPSFIACR